MRVLFAGVPVKEPSFLVHSSVPSVNSVKTSAAKTKRNRQDDEEWLPDATIRHRYRRKCNGDR